MRKYYNLNFKKSVSARAEEYHLRFPIYKIRDALVKL